MTRIKKRPPGRPKKRHPGGRPPKYKPEYPDIVYEYLSQTGAGKAKLAKLLRVSRETIYAWMETHKKFSDSITKGLEHYNNIAVKKSLLKISKGFRYTETIKEDKKPIKTIRKYVPPNISAIKHWQVNRDPKNWRDQKEVRHSGNIGVRAMKDDELEKELARLEGMIE